MLSMAHSWIAKLTKALTSLLEVHGFDSIQCHQLTQVTIMIRQAFIEDTVIHANGRPNQNWLGPTICRNAVILPHNSVCCFIIVDTLIFIMGCVRLLMALLRDTETWFTLISGATQQLFDQSPRDEACMCQ